MPTYTYTARNRAGSRQRGSVVAENRDIAAARLAQMGLQMEKLVEGKNVSAVQRALLEEEGVRFGPEGQIDLAVYGWPGPDLAEVQSLRSPLGGEASPDE